MSAPILTVVTVWTASKEQLAQFYLDEIGYDPFVDDPMLSVESVRRTVVDYIRETQP